MYRSTCVSSGGRVRGVMQSKTHEATDSTKHTRTSAIHHLVLSSPSLSEFTFDLGGVRVRLGFRV